MVPVTITTEIEDFALSPIHRKRWTEANEINWSKNVSLITTTVNVSLLITLRDSSKREKRDNAMSHLINRNTESLLTHRVLTPQPALTLIRSWFDQRLKCDWEKTFCSRSSSISSSSLIFCTINVNRMPSNPQTSCCTPSLGILSSSVHLSCYSFNRTDVCLCGNVE